MLKKGYFVTNNINNKKENIKNGYVENAINMKNKWNNQTNIN